MLAATAHVAFVHVGRVHGGVGISGGHGWDEAEENPSEYLLEPLRVIDCIAESSCVRGFVVDGGGCAAAMAMCVR